MSFVTRDDVDLVAFHLPGQHGFALALNDPRAQLLGHPLNVVRIQAEFLGDLCVRWLFGISVGYDILIFQYLARF
jgi:hypothetical protein